jgi:hypothetical protein
MTNNNTIAFNNYALLKAKELQLRGLVSMVISPMSQKYTIIFSQQNFHRSFLLLHKKPHN